MGMNQADRLGALGRKDCLYLPPERFRIVEDTPGSEMKDHRGAGLKDSFVYSIFWQGIIHPIEVRVAGKDDNGEDILDVVVGRKRVRGGLIANSWISDPSSAPNEDIRQKALERQISGDKILIPFLISPEKDPIRRFDRIVAENEHRHKSSTLAKAKQLADRLAMGGTEESACISFGVSITTIKNWQAILQCCKEIQDAIDQGTIPATAAKDLCKLDVPAQKKALSEMVTSGATKGHAAQEAAHNAARGKPAKAAQEKTRVRPRRFLERARDEFDALKSDADCKFAMNLLRFMLGDDAALSRLPESVRTTLKSVQTKGKGKGRGKGKNKAKK